MKAFIRRLSIKERKGFVNSIIYTIFSFMHLILTKTILYHSKISYITLLFISGSLLILMSFYRIFRLMKKFKSNKTENIKINFIAGFNSFISYFCLISSINSTSLTNIVFITRLFPFFIILNRIKESKLLSYHLAWFITYIITFLFIFFPALYRESGFGVLFFLFSICFKFSSYKYLSKAKGINIDFLMLNIGFYNTFFGGIIVITKFDQIEYISGFMWILILLNVMSSYFMKIFMNKVLRKNINERNDNENTNNERNTNELKLMILNIIIMYFTLPIDFYIFGEKFYYNYLVLLFSFIEIFLFYKIVKKILKSDIIYP